MATSQTSWIRRNWKLAALLVLAVVALGIVSYKIYQNHRRQNQVIIPSTIDTGSAKAPSTDKKNSATNNSGVSTTSTTDKTESPSGASLIEPSGTFVSNHRPGQNGTPTSEQSVCNTTPGASCRIEFTKAGVTKKLESQVADARGAVYWSWDVKQAGLDSGTWQITAVATLNGQTKTAKDAIALEVQP